MSVAWMRISAIAKNTFREASRNRVFAVLVLFCVGMMAFSIVLGRLSVHEEVRVMMDLGLAGMDLVGVVIALFLGVNLLSKELDKKTVYAVLPKPLPRWQFVVGKFLGLSGVMTALILAMSAVLNLFVLFVGGDVTELLLRAETLVIFEMLLVIAIAMFFASFSSPYLSAMFTAGVWMIGRGSAELEALAAGKLADSPARFVIEGLLAVLPDFSLFFVSGAVVESARVSIHETFVPWLFVLSMLGYALLYSFGALAFAAALFQRRDLT